MAGNTSGVRGAALALVLVVLVFAVPSRASCFDCCAYGTCASGWTCCGCPSSCYCCVDNRVCRGSGVSISCELNWMDGIKRQTSAITTGPLSAHQIEIVRRAGWPPMLEGNKTVGGNATDDNDDDSHLRGTLGPRASIGRR